MIHHLPSVASTLDHLHGLAQAGAGSGTVVVADEQLAGRGTRGRTWHSPPGGLWFSILYRGPETAVELLSLRLGLAVAATIEAALGPVGIGLKWPNDLMLGDRKLGGLLCEARWQGPVLAWVAVGLGLNVANPIPADVAATAVRLDAVVPGAVPAQLVDPIAAALRALPVGDPALSAEELAAFERRDWLRGRDLIEPVPGRADGIDLDGRLRIVRADGTVARAGTGHVVLAPGPR